MVAPALRATVKASSKSPKKKNANATSASFNSLLKSSEFNLRRDNRYFVQNNTTIILPGVRYLMSDERVTGLGPSSVPNLKLVHKNIPDIFHFSQYS